MSHRVKLGLFFLCAISILFVFDTAYQALATLSRLNVVEAERDQWQHPTDIIHALDLKPGSVVVDLGCGSGYFTLRLSSPVGAAGKVVAEDIRWLPLIFLWFRTLGASRRNVSIMHGAPEDPHLPAGGADAVLIANTYHEFTDSKSILALVLRSLVLGGRLVVVDRQPKAAGADSADTAREDHEVSSDQVAGELRQAGFEVVSRQDNFIEKDPFNQTWWMIVARKP